MVYIISYSQKFLKTEYGGYSNWGQGAERDKDSGNRGKYSFLSSYNLTDCF